MEEEKDTKYAKWLFAQECNFIAGADNYDAIPELHLPEIAFVGRSNVGKSSLINALTGRNTLARVSHTPGRTQQLNFFSLADKLTLVDLPGYGYAKVAKKKVANWTKLIKNYLKGRVNLKRVCLLIDSRHGLKPLDIEIMQLLDDVAVNYQIILTKIDKTSKAELNQVIESINNKMSKHAALHPTLLVSSSREATGVDEIRLELANLV